MDTLHKRISFGGLPLLAIYLLIWLVPGTVFSGTDYVEITGTLAPVERQSGKDVYKLQMRGESLLLAISGLRSYSTSYRSQNEWYYLKRRGTKRLRLVSDSEVIEQLKAGKPCDSVKISGFINYDSGLLRMIKLEPAKSNVLLAGCSF
jgi:hypothetical protein